jgi:hypothetical protein
MLLGEMLVKGDPLTKAKYQGTVMIMPISVINSSEKIRRMESTHPRIAAHIKRLWAANDYPPTGPVFQKSTEEERQQSRKAF